MTSPLLSKLGAALDAVDAPPDTHVLVAASGGPDSTALLGGLAILAAERGLRVTAGHVEHGLRGPESAGDRAAVEALAARLGVAFVARTATIARGGDLEARARRARHRALRAMATEVGAAWIALGHTEDDQVETVLLRLLRGAGRGGLGGMRPVGGHLWRPLLQITRADVRRFLADHELPFRVDRTNSDLAHTRNRLRRLVVPFLTREFNPALGSSVAALAARLRDEDDFLATVAAARAPAFARGANLAVMVAGEPAALARRIVRAWLEAHAPQRTSAHHVERVLALAVGTGRGNVAVPGGARVVREGDALVRRAGRDPIRERFHHTIAPGETVTGPGERWRLRLSPPRDYRSDDLAGLSPSRVRFDADALQLPLVVRSPAAGDRVHVPGLGTRKVQDILVDAKVPREQRTAVPVVADAVGTIVWVAGHVRGTSARITSSTMRVIDARLE